MGPEVGEGEGSAAPEVRGVMAQMGLLWLSGVTRPAV